MVDLFWFLRNVNTWKIFSLFQFKYFLFLKTCPKMNYFESTMVVKSNMEYLGKRIKIFKSKILFYCRSQLGSEHLSYQLANEEEKQVYLSTKPRERALHFIVVSVSLDVKQEEHHFLFGLSLAYSNVVSPFFLENSILQVIPVGTLMK